MNPTNLLKTLTESFAVPKRGYLRTLWICMCFGIIACSLISARVLRRPSQVEPHRMRAAEAPPKLFISFLSPFLLRTCGLANNLKLGVMQTSWRQMWKNNLKGPFHDRLFLVTLPASAFRLVRNLPPHLLLLLSATTPASPSPCLSSHYVPAVPPVASPPRKENEREKKNPLWIGVVLFFSAFPLLFRTSGPRCILMLTVGRRGSSLIRRALKMSGVVGRGRVGRDSKKKEKKMRIKTWRCEKSVGEMRRCPLDCARVVFWRRRSRFKGGVL